MAYDWDTLLTDYDAKEGERINRTLIGPPDYDVLAYLRGRANMSKLERIIEAIDSPRFLIFYLGFFAGCFFTVLAAALWGGLL